MSNSRHYLWLAVILLVAAALRGGYLYYAMHTPDYTWGDPDGYIDQARRLTTEGHWSWTFEAVTYRINQRRQSKTEHDGNGGGGPKESNRHPLPPAPNSAVTCT